MNRAYLLLGSNLGNREENLKISKELIGLECGKILQSSLIYETEPWGTINQPLFLNQALKLATSLTSSELIKTVLKIETTMGRLRVEKMGPRLIDIDILFFNDEILETEMLQLPHPELQNRKFVLTPLAEIAPLLFHSILNKTVIQLLNGCKDEMKVKTYSPIIHS